MFYPHARTIFIPTASRYKQECRVYSIHMAGALGPESVLKSSEGGKRSVWARSVNVVGAG